MAQRRQHLSCKEVYHTGGSSPSLGTICIYESSILGAGTILESDMETICIEVLHEGNFWTQVQVGIDNRSQTIAREISFIKQRYPTKRVRAIGQTSGRLYDMEM